MKTDPCPQASTAAMASSNRLNLSVPHARGILSLTECPVGDDRWCILLQVPPCFGASPNGDFVYLAGRVVTLRICLVDAHFSMSFVIDMRWFRADIRFPQA